MKEKKKKKKEKQLNRKLFFCLFKILFVFMRIWMRVEFLKWWLQRMLNGCALALAHSIIRLIYVNIHSMRTILFFFFKLIVTQNWVCRTIQKLNHIIIIEINFFFGFNALCAHKYKYIFFGDLEKSLFRRICYHDHVIFMNRMFLFIFWIFEWHCSFVKRSFVCATCKMLIITNHFGVHMKF